MEIAIYSIKDFEREGLVTAAQKYDLTLRLLQEALAEDTVNLSKGCGTICIFAGDDASAPVLHKLADNGVKYIAIRAAGYDNVDLSVARDLGISVANVPSYSPYAIAEHTIALMLALNRKLTLANKQVQTYNFTVGNLIGFDMHNKTVGIIGTGRIGGIVAGILHGFCCKLLGFDKYENNDLVSQYGLEYTTLPDLCERSDIITIHTCLTEETRHLIDGKAISAMKPGVMLINTARGAVVNTTDLIDGLASNKIGYYGADVYEHEKGIFFYDRSESRPNDPVLAKLLQMQNVLITPHQAFATQEALKNIAESTFENINDWLTGKPAIHELSFS